MNGLVKEIKNHVLKSGAEYCTADYGTREPDYATHHGIDFINANGGACEVTAIADGEVVYVQNGVRGYNEVYSAGNFVKLRHENGYFSRYLHLAIDSIRVKVGDKVKTGQVLGMEGGTGYCIPAEAVHLHFDVNDGRSYVDPLPYLTGEKTFDRVIPTSVKVGDKVRVKEGELFSNGVTPYPEVYEQTYEVLRLSLNCKEALIGIDGAYTGWMYLSSLELAETSSAEETQPEDNVPDTANKEADSDKIKSGDIVRISRKAERWENGVTIPMWVYDNEYYVSENVNGRVVVGEYEDGEFLVTGAIGEEYLEKC
ncbi:MAG: M23 family metallopeptidase [Ruminiclostridium sp.]|nr:M23 family metallopeptidase [Ruminiclostridium sp.]